jgi:hypothetical protein
MWEAVPAPIQTLGCCRIVRSIRTVSTAVSGNGATAPGANPVALRTSPPLATRISPASTAAATLSSSARRFPGTRASTKAPSQTKTIDFTIWSRRHPIARAAASAVGVPSGNSWIVASIAAARSSRATGARHGGAALDLGAELGERELDRGERHGDVEDVEPADVPDPEHARLQRSLSRCERHAVAFAEMAEQRR